MPSWKYILSYETDSMTRDEIVESTYEAALRLNRLKHEYGLIGERLYKDIDYRIKSARQIVREIDSIIKLPKDEQKAQLELMRQKVEDVNKATMCGKDELKWPVSERFSSIFSLFKVLLELFFKEWSLLFHRIKVHLTGEL